jgi:hypothetical protein
VSLGVLVGFVISELTVMKQEGHAAAPVIVPEEAVPRETDEDGANVVVTLVQSAGYDKPPVPETVEVTLMLTMFGFRVVLIPI